MIKTPHRFRDALRRAVAGNHIVPIIVFGIALVTLRPGGGGSGSTGCIICGPRGAADFLSNVILFAPLGAAIAFRKGKHWHALVLGALLSFSIEAAQWRLIPGRDSNVGDLIANSLGALLGWTLVRLRPWRPLKSSARGASLRGYGVAGGSVALLLSALTLFAPSLSRSSYYLHWTPAYESLERYKGTILNTSLGPREWLEGPHSRMERPDSVAYLLSAMPLQLRFISAQAPATLAPIVSISDENQEEVVLIGVDGSDLVYRFSSRANQLRLDDADLRVPQIFSGTQTGDTVEMSLAFETKGYCVVINGNASCGRGFSVGETWTLLLNPQWSLAVQHAFGMLWLFFAFLPSGLVTVSRRSLLIVAVGSGMLLTVGPLLLGFAVTPWFQVVAAITGLVAGYGLQTISYSASRRTIGEV